MTSQAQRTREPAQRDASRLERVDQVDELVEAFRDPLANLVDHLLERIDPVVQATMHELLAGDRADLRLTVTVAPDLSMILYLAARGTPPRAVTIATYGTEPPSIDPSAGPVH